jgi:hypothetical protein
MMMTSAGDWQILKNFGNSTPMGREYVSLGMFLFSSLSLFCSFFVDGNDEMSGGDECR